MEEQTSENAHQVANLQSVFFAGEQSGQTQCGKGEEVVTSNLKRSQYVRVLQKLQNAVRKACQ